MSNFWVQATCRTATVALLSCGALLAGPVAAQPIPPSFDNRDENGVDRVTGRYAQMMTEGGIGGENGISMVRYYGPSTTDSWTGILLRTASGSTQYATIVFDRISERFTKSGSVWIADKANGGTLIEDVEDAQFTYQAPDGTTITYRSPLAMADPGSFAATTIPQCGSYGVAASTCAVPTSVVRPNGQKHTLTWTMPVGCQYPDDGTFPGPDDPPIPCAIWFRLADVRNNSSFGMKVKYQTDTPPGSTNGAPPPYNWTFRASLTFLDLSQVYCNPSANNCDGVAGSWPTVTYSNPASNITDITNSHAGTWRIDNSTAGQTRIRRPGAASDTTVVIRDGSNRVTSLTNDGKSVTYSWTTSGSNTTSTATTGGGETGSVVSNPTVQQPTSTTAGTSATTSYVYDANMRVLKETRPEGDYTEYTRDARGNVTQARHVAKPGSGLADVVTTAGFDVTCTDTAKCNKPNWTQDALGSRTDYTYGAHGQVTRMQLPSPSADAPGVETGTRPEVNYSYTALYGREKNVSGVLVDATTPQFCPRRSRAAQPPPPVPEPPTRQRSRSNIIIPIFFRPRRPRRRGTGRSAQASPMPMIRAIIWSASTGRWRARTTPPLSSMTHRIAGAASSAPIPTARAAGCVQRRATASTATAASPRPRAERSRRRPKRRSMR
jgi:YD repeat-containing protein